MSNVIELNDSNKHLLLGDGPMAIKFYAPWCGPCKSYAKTFESASNNPEFIGKVTFISVDVDTFRVESDMFGIRTVPSTVFKARNEAKVISGIISPEALEDHVRYHST